MISILPFISLALPLLATAQLVPTGPGPNDVFKQGTPCSVSWTPDTSGKWKNTFIELMTGPNQQMVHLATVAMVDGTDPTKTSFAFPCPTVSPNAPIYFYQFTAQGQNATWTGRFAISNPSGATTSPPNANQPDGEAIPWGTGKLLDASQGSPPPPTAPSGQIDGSGSGSSGAPSGGTLSPPVLTASGAPNASASSLPTLSPTTAPPAPASAPATPSSGISTVRSVTPTPTPAASSPSTAPATTSSTSPNGAIVNSLSPSVLLAAAMILSFVSF